MCLSTTGLTAAQWALNAAFYASPLGWIALAIGAVIAAVTYCWQKFEGFRRVILGVWEVVKEFGKTLLAIEKLFDNPFALYEALGVFYDKRGI